MPKTLPLMKIRIDGGTQVRVELDKDTFLEYGRQMAAGIVFPPVDVFHDGATYWLADGFHRFFGARDNGLMEIAVKIHRGTVRDAILFAIGANATHGKPRSNKDKRHAVEMLLADEDWREWSDVKLAEVAMVGKTLVGEVRNQLVEKTGCDPPATTIGKDGKRRKKPKPRKPKIPTRTFVDEEPDEVDEIDTEPCDLKNMDIPSAASIENAEPLDCEEDEDDWSMEKTIFQSRLETWLGEQSDDLGCGWDMVVEWTKEHLQ